MKILLMGPLESSGCLGTFEISDSQTLKDLRNKISALTTTLLGFNHTRYKHIINADRGRFPLGVDLSDLRPNTEIRVVRKDYTEGQEQIALTLVAKMDDRDFHCIIN